MRSLISALAAAGLLMFTLSCYSADEPYTGQSKANKPGRAGEEKQAVKSKPDPNKPGRAGEEKQAVKSKPDPEQVRPRRRGKAGSQVRRSSREPRPHGREEVSGIQGPLKAPWQEGQRFRLGALERDAAWVGQ